MNIKNTFVKEMSLRKNSVCEIQYIITVFVIIAIVLPILLEYIIFRNSIVSVLSNGEWSSFLGSFLGGIIGGVGTLMAVYITTKETRNIQEETNNSIEADRKARRWSEKKEFVNQITIFMGEYIADISAWFYANRFVERLENEKHEFTKKIDELDSELIKEHESIESCPESGNDFIISTSYKIEKLNIKKSKLIMKKNDKEKEIEKLQKNRLIANKHYFTIKIMLKSIECSLELISQLDLVHNFEYKQNFEVQIDRLMELTEKFGCDYIN